MESISRFFGSFPYQRFDEPGSAISEASFANPFNEPEPLAACRVGDLGRLDRELQKDRSIVYQDYRSVKSGNIVSLLVIAVAQSHVELARLLIDQGAYVDYVTKDGFTPLRYAVHKDHVELAQLLIGKGAHVDQVNKIGGTLLMHAAFKGYVELARLLIDEGAEVNLVTKKGATALYLAVQEANNEVARLLISKGADVDLAVEGGSTPLSCAADRGYVELARLLIDNGAKVNLADKKGGTPLFFAAQNGNNEIVELLLANDADPKKKMKLLSLGRYSFTKSPLGAAIVSRDKKTVKMIKTAIKERKIHSSSECPLLLAGQYASDDEIR